MSVRENLKKDFLKKNKLGKAERVIVSADASFRSYERIISEKKSFILMDAPPAKEDIKPFINIDNYLRRRGFSAPEIYSKDEKNGFMLLEDLGDDSFTRVLAGKSPLSDKYNEYDLYSAAIDVLIQLDRSTLPQKTPDYDYELLKKECRLFIDWFLPNIGFDGDIQKSSDEYLEIWDELLNIKKVHDDVIVLRDYHADNLMWIPERVGVERVGLLDFQDAVIGSPVYDIVSLLEDARRDVTEETVKSVIKRYLDSRKTIHQEDFFAVYSTLAAQRNCKIIGIFARLAIRDNKPKYISYMPRVWKHLENDLKHPALKNLKAWMNKIVPSTKRKPESFIYPPKVEALLG